MPLSELLYRMAKGEIDSSQEKHLSSFPPANDVVELVWENGQVHTCRGRKIETCNNCSSHSSKIRGRDMASGTNSKLVKFGLMDPVLPQVPMPAEMGLDQDQDQDDDDDMVPWLTYPNDEYLQHDPCPEFSPELSGVTVNQNSSQNNFVSSSYRSNRDRFLEIQDGLGLVQEKFCSIGDGDAAWHRTGAGQLYATQSQQYHMSFPCFRSRISANAGDNAHGATATHHTVSDDSTRILTSRGGFPATKMQNPVASASTSNPLSINFLHLSRPPAIDKANLDTIGATTSSGISSMERIGTKDRSSTSNANNPVESSLIDSCSGTKSHCHPMVSSKLEPKSVDTRLAKEPVPAELPKAVSGGDDSMNNKNCGETFGESGTKGMEDDEKNVEPLVASSVCSVNSVERASEDMKQNLKRKHQDTEESVGPSEDIEEESVGAKKAVPTRGTGTKRSRAAEVHNLSERRRRDRINEKMRALQELIPNCNKVDKASMLDEAIEYLKTLQLQLQIMSVGAGLYMPSMMLPPAMPHMHAAHMARFSNMSIGMGMGFGNGGPSGCSMLPVPPMTGPHFPAPSPMNGLGFGISDQGLPMLYARPPLMPMSGGPILNATMGMNARGLVGPLDHLDSAPSSIPNTNPQVTQQRGANSSMIHTSSQCQATNECHEQSAVAENSCQASEVTNNEALKQANANDLVEAVATER